MQYASGQFIPTLCHDNLFSGLFMATAYTTDPASCCETPWVVWNLFPPHLLGRTIFHVAQRVRDTFRNSVASTTLEGATERETFSQAAHCARPLTSRHPRVILPLLTVKS